MKLGTMLGGIALAMTVASPVMAQSDTDTAREIYPMLIECGMVSAMSAEYGYTSRHPMDKWVELIVPAAEMIGANAEADITKWPDDRIARVEREGVDATSKWIVDTAKMCDEVMDAANS